MVNSSYEYVSELAEVVGVMVFRVMQYVALQLLGFVHVSFRFTRERPTAWNKLWDRLLSDPARHTDVAQVIEHGSSDVD